MEQARADTCGVTGCSAKMFCEVLIIELGTWVRLCRDHEKLWKGDKMLRVGEHGAG